MNNSKLYVGNLPFSSTEADVEALFSSYGEVVDVSRPIDASNVSSTAGS